LGQQSKKVAHKKLFLLTTQTQKMNIIETQQQYMEGSSLSFDPNEKERAEDQEFDDDDEEFSSGQKYDDDCLDEKSRKKKRSYKKRNHYCPTIAEIKQTFHLPLEQAAQTFNICVSKLKKLCREHGITRWPYRKVRSQK